MTSESKQAKHDFESHQSTAPGLLSKDTDASAGRLLDVLILKQLKSLENSSMGDVVAKLIVIEKHLHDEHQVAADASGRIEASLARIEQAVTDLAENGKVVGYEMHFTNPQQETKE